MRNRKRPHGKLLLFGIALVLAMPTPGHSATGSGFPFAGDWHAIENLRAAWLCAVNAGDVDDVVALYGPGAVVFPEGGTPVFGAHDIARWHDRWLDAADIAYDLEASDIRFGGDVVTEQWSARVTVELRPGGPMSVGGDVFQFERRIVRVYRRIASGDWRIDREIWSADPPALRPYTEPWPHSAIW